ncbi:MAG: hypothetical protein ACREA0_01460 [bacterium]
MDEFAGGEGEGGRGQSYTRVYTTNRWFQPRVAYDKRTNLAHVQISISADTLDGVLAESALVVAADSGAQGEGGKGSNLLWVSVVRIASWSRSSDRHWCVQNWLSEDSSEVS